MNVAHDEPWEEALVLTPGHTTTPDRSRQGLETDGGGGQEGKAKKLQVPGHTGMASGFQWESFLHRGSCHCDNTNKPNTTWTLLPVLAVPGAHVSAEGGGCVSLAREQHSVHPATGAENEVLWRMASSE